MFDLSHYASVNEFLNALLKSIAFKEDKQDVILDKLEQVEDKTNAVYELVKKNDR